MAFIMTYGQVMVQFLKVPVNGNPTNFENQIIPSVNYLFSKLV